MKKAIDVMVDEIVRQLDVVIADGRIVPEVAIARSNTIRNVIREQFEAAFPSTCLRKAWEGEPLFVVRSQDRTGPATVRDWGRRAFNVGARDEKVDGAMVDAVRMEEWQKANASLVKTPD